MEPILHHSIARATEAATALWSLASTQFPKNDLLLAYATGATFDHLSMFALNARRAMEHLSQRDPIALDARRWSS
jgi:hypothetical protein